MTVKVRFGLACGMLVALVACHGRQDQAPPADSYLDPVTYSTAPSASLISAGELQAITHHQITLGGSAITYTATTGHLTARDMTYGAPEASLFYVAYTVDGKAAATRPLTFIYNGGPGSSSVLLHLGSFGPKRLVTGDPATTEPKPFPLVDNQECLLDQTDMVFIDPVGTGLSEAIAPYTNQTFWSVDTDAAVLRDFIIRYLAVNLRQDSPKYLFGESYGTPRSAVLANKLETAGVSLSGVVLQSSILNFNTNAWWTGDLLFNNSALFPTYTATWAWYQKAYPNPTDLGAFEQTMRDFTNNSYSPAVGDFLANQGLTSSGQALIPQLVSDTGIPASIWSSTDHFSYMDNFNLHPYYFQVGLIPGSITGIYDARVSAGVNSALAKDGDPSYTLVAESFSTAINSYLHDFLGYSNPSPYITMSDAINTWNFSHDGSSIPDTIPDLSAALTMNHGLKVFSANGYYDLITPFFQTEQDLARLAALPFAVDLRIKEYTGGHMTYLDDAARPVEKADLVAFYQGLPGAPMVALDQGPAPAGRALAQKMQTGARSVVQAQAPRPLPKALSHSLEPIVPTGFRATATVPPTTGARLLNQVEQNLKAHFDAADLAHRGALTRTQAAEGGLGFVSRHFNDIDVYRTGEVTFEDVKRYLSARK